MLQISDMKFFLRCGNLVVLITLFMYSDMKCYQGYRTIAVALQGDPFNINCFPTDIHKADEVTN